MIRLFVEDNKGYMDTYNNVYRVCIKRIENKKHLIIKYNSLKEDECIPLSDIRLCFLVDTDTMHEYFRYEK